MKILIVLSIILVNIAFSQSQYSFLDYNQSARAVSLAGAAVSIDNDISNLTYNPALLSTIENKFLNVTYNKFVSDINAGNIIFGYDKFDFGKVAAAVQFNDWGNFNSYNSSAQNTGQFSGLDFAFGLYYSAELDTNLYYGLALKYVYSGIENISGSLLAVDAGLFYRYNERTNLGVSILNAGAQISNSNNENIPSPLDVRIGGNHRLRGLPITLNLSMHNLATGTFPDKIKNVSLGLELELGDYIRARAGYNNRIRNTTASQFDPGLAGLSFGLGLIMKKAGLDYSLSSYGASNYQHRFSLLFDI